MRPQSRPLQPYTNQEIIDRIWQHFFVENNNQGYDAAKHSCCYNLTGCAVGCLLTQEDAENIPNGSVTTSDIRTRLIQWGYFNGNDNQFMLLRHLQIVHDFRSGSSLNGHFSHELWKNMFKLSLLKIIKEHNLIAPQET